MEEQRCHVCGEPATGHFGAIPLCNNIACHTLTIERINAILAEVAEDSDWQDYIC